MCIIFALFPKGMQLQGKEILTNYEGYIIMYIHKQKSQQSNHQSLTHINQIINMKFTKLYFVSCNCLKLRNITSVKNHTQNFPRA